MELIDKIRDIVNMTMNNQLGWAGTSSKYCFYSSYENRGIVICKYYPADEDTMVSSLSFLNDDGMLSDEQYQWSEETPEFEELSKLYDYLSNLFHEKFEKHKQ